MNRLTKGALADKITSSLLASAVLVSTPLPIHASDWSARMADGTNVKTLAPLATTGDAAAPADVAAAPKSTLQFNPAPTSNSAPDSAPDSVSATADDAGTTGEAAKKGVQAASADLITNPEAMASPSSKDDAAAAKSDAASTDSADAPALRDSTTGDADNSGKDLAQAAAAHPRTPTDPIYTKLPTVVGRDIKTHRAFSYFPSQQIIHNLAFRDTPVKEVIAELAHRGNLNIILDKSCIGQVTGDLHDLTLNEAMDTVLSATGLQCRQLDSSTLIIGMPNALFRLGLNRPLMRVFKISYASVFDVAQILYATCFNPGTLTDFSSSVRAREINLTRDLPTNKTIDQQDRVSTSPTPGGGTQVSKTQVSNQSNTTGNNENESGDEELWSTKTDGPRSIRGSIREQVNEGSGFNSGSTDPGSQSIRSTVNVVTDFSVEQNGGRAIAIPDQKNRQVIVCGTQDDINIAEECIRLIDRRPRQVHIQSSLVEINNAGIRQLGANLNLQGAGASGTVLGGSGAPLINFLPGLGSGQTTQTQTFTNGLGNSSITQNVAGFGALPLAFSQTLGGITRSATTTQNLQLAPNSANGFVGLLGNVLPLTTPSIAGVSALNQSVSGFNFLTLSKSAGGRANIATVPIGLNFSLNLILQTNKAKLLANPTVVVNDNTESLITLANEVVHKVTTTVSLGVVSTNVELVKAGIFLDVVPKITEDGFVTLRLRPQVSQPLGGPQSFANGSVIVTLLNVRDIMTQEVRIKDGQTLVIGGLFTEQEAATLSKVPYLAEAPILGALFRNTLKGRNRTELMLLITPKIVEDQPPNSISEGAGPTSL